MSITITIRNKIQLSHVGLIVGKTSLTLNIDDLVICNI